MQLFLRKKIFLTHNFEEVGSMTGSSAINNKRRQIGYLISDIAAMILFSTALCMIIEIFVAGLSFFQSVGARIAAIPVNLITGRPYGWFRDTLFLTLGIDRSSPVKLFLGDTLAFVVFQVPLYVLVLLFAGATWKQIAVTSFSASLVFSLTGRPYGIFLDFCRRIAVKLLG